MQGSRDASDHPLGQASSSAADPFAASPPRPTATTRVRAVCASGRVTMPVEVGRGLGLEGETEVEVELEGVSIILRPTAVGGRENAWAYTPEPRAFLSRAHMDSRAGRVLQLTAGELQTRGS